PIIRLMPNPSLNLRSRPALVLISLLFAAALLGEQALAELRVPAFTAYFDSDPEGVRVRESSGVSIWKGPALQVLWFGELKATGKLDCALSVRLPTNIISRLRLSMAGQSHEATANGDGKSSVIVSFGSFDIPTVG